MKYIAWRRRISEEAGIQLAPDPLAYKYPLIYAESKKDHDISLVITDSSNEKKIPPGIYYFNQVICTCPHEKTGLLYRIQSVFIRSSSQTWAPSAPCNLHSLNYDLLLESQNLFHNINPSLKAKLGSDVLPYVYPLVYADSKTVSDISLVIKNHSNLDHISPGVYHFNYVSCTCPYEKTGLLHRIQSIFKRKSSQNWVPTALCNLHSSNYEVIIEFHTLKKA